MSLHSRWHLDGYTASASTHTPLRDPPFAPQGASDHTHHMGTCMRVGVSTLHCNGRLGLGLTVRYRITHHGPTVSPLVCSGPGNQAKTRRSEGYKWSPMEAINGVQHR